MTRANAPDDSKRQTNETRQPRSKRLAGGYAWAFEELAGIARALWPAPVEARPNLRSEPYFGSR